MTDMVAYMQGGMMTRQYQMHAHDFQRGANCRLEPFRKFIQFGSVTHPLVIFRAEQQKRPPRIY